MPLCNFMRSCMIHASFVLMKLDSQHSGHDNKLSDDAAVGNGFRTEPADCAVSGVRQLEDGWDLVEATFLNLWGCRA